MTVFKNANVSVLEIDVRCVTSYIVYLLLAGLEPATFSYCSTDRCLPGLEPVNFSFCSTDRYLLGLEPVTFSFP